MKAGHTSPILSLGQSPGKAGHSFQTDSYASQSLHGTHVHCKPFNGRRCPLPLQHASSYARKNRQTRRDGEDREVLRNKTPRAICLDLLNRMEEADRHPDDLLTDSFKRYRHLTPRDRSFLTELTYGTLRWRGKLDWIIRHFSNVPFEKIETSILHTLRIGLYQILFMSRTPVSAAVNESVELAKKFRSQGGASFVNAILRSFIRQKEEMSYPALDDDPALHIAVVQSHPLWLVQRWVEEMGAEGTLKVCTDNNQIASLTLRANTLKISRDRLIEALKEKGLEPFPTTLFEGGHCAEEPSTRFRITLSQRGSLCHSR